MTAPKGIAHLTVAGYAITLLHGKWHWRMLSLYQSINQNLNIEAHLAGEPAMTKQLEALIAKIRKQMEV